MSLMKNSKASVAPSSPDSRAAPANLPLAMEDPEAPDWFGVASVDGLIFAMGPAPKWSRQAQGMRASAEPEPEPEPELELVDVVDFLRENGYEDVDELDCLKENQADLDALRIWFQREHNVDDDAWEALFEQIRQSVEVDGEDSTTESESDSE